MVSMYLAPLVFTIVGMVAGTTGLASIYGDWPDFGRFLWAAFVGFWAWVACLTSGVGLVLVGPALLRRGMTMFAVTYVAGLAVAAVGSFFYGKTLGI